MAGDRRRSRELRRGPRLVAYTTIDERDPPPQRGHFCIAAGASPNEIARRAGHASVATVLNRYDHLLPETEQAVPDQLEKMVVRSRLSDHRPAEVIELDGRHSSCDGLQTA